MFVLEVVVLSAVEIGYYRSFFFYMDVLGTLSIILDIGYISGSSSRVMRQHQGLFCVQHEQRSWVPVWSIDAYFEGLEIRQILPVCQE